VTRIAELQCDFIMSAVYLVSVICAHLAALNLVLKQNIKGDAMPQPSN